MSFQVNLILLLTFLCGALATQELDVTFAHSSCPLVDDYNHLVMLPYGPDCSKYYRCLNGQAYLQQCPYNLHWSAATYRCDYPEIARCQAIVVPIPTTPTTPSPPPPPTPYPPTDFFYQSYPNNCNMYYQCQARACPSNLYWNSYTQQCDYPQNVQCSFGLGDAVSV